MVLGETMFRTSNLGSPGGGGISATKFNLGNGLATPSRPDFHNVSSPVVASPRTPSDRTNGATPMRCAAPADWMSKVEYALSAPNVPQKVFELTPLLESCPLKDLPDVYRSIVERVFSQGPRGWSLSLTQKSAHPREYVTISQFLCATGPLLSACNRLLSDPYVRFDFPVSKLSPATRGQLEVGQLSPFLAIKLPASLTSSTLHLNSFEFYMFSFAAYIVQPDATDNRFIAGESVYPYILEDYLTYFLPCNGSSVPPLPFQLAVPSSPPQTVPEPCFTPHKSLLRQTYLNPSSSTPCRAVSPPSNTPLPTGETWRSETLVSTFTEFWLTQFVQNKSSYTTSPGLPSSSEPSIAVSDTLRIVRMLIKHLHYFSNSGGPNDIIPLDQLKRSVIPSVKKQLYHLFKYTFSHWPHDASFRLVLETWLSYVQPWRYTENATLARERGGGEDGVVDHRWQVFIAENVVLYTAVLRQLLPRFFRMDLTASKNAYMLFRISKVFSQHGLVEMVRSAEAGLDKVSSMNGGYGSTSGLHSFSNIPGEMSRVEADESLTSAARFHLQDMEGAGARYSPVFSTEFRETVFSLLSVAARACAAAKESLAECGKGVVVPPTGLGWIKTLLEGGTTTSNDTQEEEELKKTVQYLSSSVTSLSQVFELQNPTEMGHSVLGGEAKSHPGSRSPEMTDKGMLTPHGRWQVVQGVAKPDVKYEGDPDLRPITSNELVVMVRVLHGLSNWIRTRYQDKLSRLYYSPGLVGICSRLVLAPPTTFYTRTRSLSGGCAMRATQRHPARLVLRPLADKHVLGYLTLAILVLHFFGWGYVSGLVLLLLLAFVGLVGRGAWLMVTGQEEGANKRRGSEEGGAGGRRKESEEDFDDSRDGFSIKSKLR